MDIILRKQKPGLMDRTQHNGPWYYAYDHDEKSITLLSHLLGFSNTGFPETRLQTIALLAKAHGWRLVIDGKPFNGNQR